jgi:hypothetical protein
MQAMAGEPSDPAAYVIDLVTVVLLSIATLASSWGTYQAARWSGKQAAKYNQANARRIESARTADRASTQQLADVVAFTTWLAAYTARNAELEAFLRQRARAEFRPALEAWIASRPLVNPRAAPSPFALPEYRLELQDQAVRLQKESQTLFEEGQLANEYGDTYVLDSVVFSGVLFFAAISQQLRRRSMRLALLGLAGLLCLAGLTALVRLPIT